MLYYHFICHALHDSQTALDIYYVHRIHAGCMNFMTAAEVLFSKRMRSVRLSIVV